MSIKSKIKTFFFLDDEYDYEEEKYEEDEIDQRRTNKPPVSKQNVVSLQSIQKSSKLVLCEPRVYAEAQDISDHLKNRRSVVVNLQRIDHDQAKRIVDFLSGTVYAIGGDIQKIGMNIFLCTPDNVEVSGNISEFLQEHDIQNSRW
ncbi:MAG: cell division protein sepF [Bacillus sp. (in: firmicutes)]|jgi:cell division inhibitor SepF|uniref:cell division protein SepF n=1 Tax=Bacillus sp. 1NLA3E TaxID=666686 RepID=UPI000247E574|nr:cell division protein SepF [Bacillus sp. 1NLA3E]AGK53001.1 cell division protein sepF [Bacillus sp. 1NLA3E]MDF2903201.1 cell division protein sepF [Bacillus sp. (in: firmicutes)]